MKNEDLAGKKILLVGFGREGKATLAYLKHTMPELAVAVADEKDGPQYLDVQKDFDLAIRSPGVPKKYITIPHTTATNIFFANTRGMVIGVTGTKGKSTTASLIYRILIQAGIPAKLVGNIGNPMLEALSQEESDKTVYVCELSSYQLDDIAYSPHISVFINFFPEHMNYHGSVENYWQAKARLVQFATKEDYFVYNNEYDRLKTLATQTQAKSVPFVETLPFPAADIPLLGEHNKANVRAAVTVATLLGIAVDQMHTAVKEFKGLPHRMEFVGEYQGIRFYDDAISTTPESTIAAINSIPNVSTILLGGEDRGYDFSALAGTIIAKHIRFVVLFPNSGEKIKAALAHKGATGIELLETRDMEKAVQFAYGHATQGGVCLLSCASPSYSVWKNFEEKGNLFQKYVKEQAEGGKK